METSTTAFKKESIDMTEPTVPPASTNEIQLELGTLKEISEAKPVALSPVPAESVNPEMNIQNDSNKPDYRLLKKTLDKTHARTKYKEPYGWFEACFRFKTGWHRIFKTSSQSDLDKFGAGMVLYFRFVKYLICFFLAFSILSAPSLYFAIKASENFGINGVTDYKGWLYFTTLGSIGRGTSHCSQAKIGDTVNFYCDKGNLGSGIQYGRIVNGEEESCELFSMFSWDERCNNDNQQPLKDAFASCQGFPSCQIEVKADFFDFSKPGCQPWNPAQNPKASFYLRALCENVEIALPGGKTVDKNTIGYILASCDAAICVLFILMLLFLKGLEQKTVTKIKGNVDAVDTYSIQVSHLPKRNKEELKRELWKYFSEVIDNGNKKVYNVVDVQLAEPQPILDLQIQLEALKKNKAKVFRRFYEKWAKKPQSEDIKIKYKDLSQLASKGSPKLLQDFRTIKQLKEKQTKLKVALQHEKNKKKVPVARAFVTFLTKKQRDEVCLHFKRSSLTHLWRKLFGCFYNKKINAFHGASLKIKEAPAPNNIIWAHLNTGKFEKALRRLVSWVITIGFWAISFAFIVFAKSGQQEISKIVRPIQSCSEYANVTPEEVEADNLKGDEAQGLLECYCSASVERQLLDTLCSERTFQKFLTNALPFLVVASIILTNYGLQYVFKKLTSFERYQSISNESTSRIVKIFVAQLLNTGIIILIVNAKFTRNPIVSFLNGNYDDLIPEWYLNVGTTLLITMIINIVNLPIINTLFFFFRACARCLDRGCTCNPEKTKKKTQEEWEELYTGPEFLVDFRYAQILTVVSICFLYSAGLPLLYLSTFLNLAAVYWMDKLFLLKVCRLPRMFDEDLESVVRKALYLCMFLHLIFAIWTYGNPQIFGDQDSYTRAVQLTIEAQDIKFSYFLESFWDRATERQNIVLSIIMCVFVGTLAAVIIFRATMFRMVRACLKNYVNRIRHRESYRNQRTYYECIHLEDLYLEKKYLENEIYESIDGGLQEILEKKLEMINQELKKRDPAEENHLKRFIGIFSYFVGHNPLYKKFFNVKKVKTANLIVT